MPKLRKIISIDNVHVLPSHINKTGFNEEYFNEALLKLSKTVIDLNY